LELENVTFWQPFSGKGVCHVDSCIREDGTDFHHGSVVVFIYCDISPGPGGQCSTTRRWDIRSFIVSTLSMNISVQKKCQ